MVPDSEGSQLLPEDLGSGEPVSGLRPLKRMNYVRQAGRTDVCFIGPRIIYISDKFQNVELEIT